MGIFRKNRKKILGTLAIVLLGGCMVFPSLADENKKVTFDKNELELKVGETGKLKAELVTITSPDIASGGVIFVSGEGNDDNAGAIDTPLLTVQAALDRAKPGDTVYLREGTYTGCNYFASSGSKEGGYITVTSYNGEKAVVTTKSGTSGAAFSLEGNDYIKIENLCISGLKAKDVYGVLMGGGESYVYIENCEFSDIVTTSPGSKSTPGGSSNAILLFGEGKTAADSINHIYISNNKVHDNVNGWSENISVAGNCEYVFVDSNLVYDCTNIGIDFYGNAEYCSDKSLDQPRHCECTGNVVYNCNSFYSENAGIYVDGSYDILVRENESYKNAYGIEVGSEEWRSYYADENRVREITVCGNSIHDNTECGLRIGGWSNDSTTGVVYNCTVCDNSFSSDGSDEIIISKCDSIYFKNNKFDSGLTYDDVVWYDDEIDSSKITNIFFE